MRYRFFKRLCSNGMYHNSQYVMRSETIPLLKSRDANGRYIFSTHLTSVFDL